MSLPVPKAVSGSGGGPDLSDSTPNALGTANAGTSDEASRADHRHAMPTASDVGASPAGHTHVIGDVTTLQTTLDAKIAATEKGSANGVATLDSGSKVPISQLPALAITSTYTAASQAAMLALDAQEGDVAIRTDTSETYILSTSSPTTLADWKLILSPTDGVTSFNSRSGAVSPTTGDYSIGQITGAGDAAAKNTGTANGTVAAGDDSRFPTANEKAALAGTGTPSGSNKYVTNDDSRLNGITLAQARALQAFGGF